MAEVQKKQPQDRKAPAKKAAPKNSPEAQKKAVAAFMASGIDFTPFTIDAGDGIEWGFKPDPMPNETTRIQASMEALEAAVKAPGGSGINEAYDNLVDAVRSLLVDEEQVKEFPRPLYGTNAILFFAMHLMAGRSGFPTE